MLKVYKRPAGHIKVLLNPTNDKNFETLYGFSVRIVRHEDNSIFKNSWQKEYVGIVASGGVRVVDVSELPVDANIIGN